MRPIHQHVFARIKIIFFVYRHLLQEDTSIDGAFKVMRMLKFVCWAPPSLRMVHELFVINILAHVFSDMALRSWKQLANACPSTAQKVAVSFWRSTHTNVSPAVRNVLNGAHHRHTCVYHRISATGLSAYAVRTIHSSSE